MSSDIACSSPSHSALARATTASRLALGALLSRVASAVALMRCCSSPCRFTTSTAAARCVGVSCALRAGAETAAAIIAIAVNVASEAGKWRRAWRGTDRRFVRGMMRTEMAAGR